MDQTIVIKDNNRYSLENLKKFFDYAQDGMYRIEVYKVRKKRSLDQNGWLFGVIYKDILKALQNEGWDFTCVEQVHEYFKALFNKEKRINKFTGEVIEIGKSTAEMNTVEFSEYCEMLRDYAREFLNIEIEEPNKLWNKTQD